MRHQVRSSAYAASGSCVRGHSELLCPRMWILLFLLLILSFTTPAYAACTSPAGSEGDIVYNSANNVPEVCTGSAWMAMGALNPAAGAAGAAIPPGSRAILFTTVPSTSCNIATAMTGKPPLVPAACPAQRIARISAICARTARFLRAGIRLRRKICSSRRRIRNSPAVPVPIR